MKLLFLLLPLFLFSSNKEMENFSILIEENKHLQEQIKENKTLNKNNYRVYENIFLTDVEPKDNKSNCSFDFFLNTKINKCTFYENNNLKNINSILINGKNLNTELFDNLKIFYFKIKINNNDFLIYDYFKDKSKYDKKSILDSLNKILNTLKEENYTLEKYFIEEKENIDFSKLNSVEELLFKEKNYNRVVSIEMNNFSKEVNIKFIPNLRMKKVMEDFFEHVTNKKSLDQLYEFTNVLKEQENNIKEEKNIINEGIELNF